MVGVLLVRSFEELIKFFKFEIVITNWLSVESVEWNTGMGNLNIK